MGKLTALPHKVRKRPISFFPRSCYTFRQMKGFSDKQIISMLDSRSMWGKRACREILRRKEDFIPPLLAVLDNTLANLDAVLDEDKNTFVPAAFLLAQMREKQAYPRLAALINFDDRTVERLWEDVLVQSYCVILRDTFNGDSSVFKPIIENCSAGPWARSMAISAWGLHFHDGHISREEITAYYRRLIHEVFTRPKHGDQLPLFFLAMSIRENRLEALIQDILPICKSKLILPELREFLATYEENFDDPLFVPDDRHIDDAIAELNQLGWFEEREEDDDDDDDDDEYYDDDEYDDDEW